MSFPGHFITFEGIDGSGKSTQASILAKTLSEKGKNVLLTREPGGTHISESIRNLLKDPILGQNMSPKTELLLFEASRAQLVSESILPALQMGKIVICDRFTDSTTLYQGLAREIEPTLVETLNNFACQGIQPSVTVLLDLPPDILLTRLQARLDTPTDRIEQENLSFFKTIRQGYLELVRSEPERFIIADATLDVQNLSKEIFHAISKRIHLT